MAPTRYIDLLFYVFSFLAPSFLFSLSFPLFSLSLSLPFPFSSFGAPLVTPWGRAPQSLPYPGYAPDHTTILNPFKVEAQNFKMLLNFILQKCRFPNICEQLKFISFSVAVSFAA